MSEDLKPLDTRAILRAHGMAIQALAASLRSAGALDLTMLERSLDAMLLFLEKKNDIEALASLRHTREGLLGLPNSQPRSKPDLRAVPYSSTDEVYAGHPAFQI